jgi:hypothetical protein
MKKLLLCLSIAVLAPIAQSHASHSGVNVDIRVGVPVAAGYVASPVVIASPPVFVAPPQLGFYVAVGVPYDLFYFGNRYYLSHGNRWYASQYYNGPWAKTSSKKVPHGLRKLPIEKVHYYKNQYHKKHGKHEFRQFRPDRRDSGRDGHGRGRDGYGRGR